MKKKTKKKTTREKKIDPYKVIEAGVMLAEQNIKVRISSMGLYEMLSHAAFVELGNKCMDQQKKPMKA